MEVVKKWKELLEVISTVFYGWRTNKFKYQDLN